MDKAWGTYKPIANVLAKLLHFTAVWLIVFLPIIISFYGKPQFTKTTVVNNKTAHHYQVASPAHGDGWNMIKNRHLLAPHQSLRNRVATSILLLFIVFFAGLLKRPERLLSYSICKTGPFQLHQKYIFNQNLLI